MRLLPVRLPESPGGDDGAAVPPDHGQLIGRSFYIYTRVRTAVVLVVVTAAVFGRHVLGMNAIDVKQLTILAAFITLYNVVAWFFFRRYRDPDAPAASLAVLLFLTYAAVVLDFIALTVAIWFVGGARSPFTSFYLLHVMVSCTLLPRRAALALTALAYGLSRRPRRRRVDGAGHSRPSRSARSRETGSSTRDTRSRSSSSTDRSSP